MSLFGTTDTFGFNLIDFSSQVWHTDEFANWRKLDSILTSLDTTVKYGLDIGAVNAYLVTYTPAVAAYADGLILAFKPLHTNTGASTINVNGLGVKNIKFNGSALLAGDIAIGGYVKLVYNNDHFEVIEPKIVRIGLNDGSVTPVKLSTGAPTWDGSGNFSATGNVTAGGSVIAPILKSDTNQMFYRQASNSYTSAVITYSTSSPSGGNDGDVWFKYT